ncbi:hypothetical protein ACP4OV_012949 [Aristida adscensionis]
MAFLPVWRRQLTVVLLPLVLLLMLSSRSVQAASARRHGETPAALPPAAVAADRARREFHVVPAPAPAEPRTERPGHGVSEEDGAARRPVREWRRRRVRRGSGGGNGAWAFSAMLPRGFVPPSGSSACHNDMPATAVDAQFFACSGRETP